MSIEIIRSDKSTKSTPENAVWKFIQDGGQFLHLEIDDQPLWGITWYTTVPTKAGLDAIRQSHLRLKGTYQETRELPKLRRVSDDLFGEGIVGPVNFVLQGYDAPSDDPQVAISGRTMAIELSQFMNPSSLDNEGNGRNLLRLIRVDTEYLSYYFQGEATPLHDQPDGSVMDPPKFPSREFGLIGNYCAVDEVLQLFQQTSSTKLETNGLTVVHRTLEELLGTFSRFSKRLQ